jgi:hypothetical protein
MTSSLACLRNLPRSNFHSLAPSHDLLGTVAPLRSYVKCECIFNGPRLLSHFSARKTVSLR